MIKVLKNGLHTSIQDVGRFGFRNLGVPVSGAMDTNASKLANVMLGNSESAAVMEITLQGPRLVFQKSTTIALTGANLSPNLNDQSIDLNRKIKVKKGDVMSFGRRMEGVRCYLAVEGGFKTEYLLGSRSQYQGITSKSKIEVGDVLKMASRVSRSSAEVSLQYKGTKLLSTTGVYAGPEFSILDKAKQEFLFESEFTLGMNNRMAYQLQELLPNAIPSILSSAVFPGTVQLTPSGKMIILMRDCQTTGGYPRILQLSESAINSLSQKMQFENVKFQLINV